MSTEKPISEQLRDIFTELNISVTGHEIKEAEEMLTLCKHKSMDAYDAALNILGHLEMPITGNLTNLKNALVAHRIFKN